MAYESMNAIQIGNRIKSLRENSGKTQEAASIEIGISQNAIAMYETGKRIPRDEIKIRIAEYFHVPVESIFFPKKQHETCGIRKEK